LIKGRSSSSSLIKGRSLLFIDIKKMNGSISCETINGNSNTIAFGCIWLSINNEYYDDIIVYAMNNVIAISNLKTKSVLCTIKGHSGRINAIDKIINNDTIDIVSASEDKTIRVYQCMKTNLLQWKLKATLNGFEASVITLSCLNVINIGTVIAASDAIGLIKIWHNDNDKFELVDEIKTAPIQMPHALKLTSLPKPGNHNHIIALLLGCVDAKIHMNISTAIEKTGDIQSSLSKFLSIGSLYGHEEWITCIASRNVDDDTVLIASGSQDSKIRVWRISREFKNVDSIDSNNAAVEVSKVEDANVEDDANEGDNIDAEEGAVQLVQEEISSEARIVFESLNSVYSIFFDALLLGHEDWVTSVGWLTNLNSTENKKNSFSLFSSSMDRNMIIWKENDVNGGVWEPRTRIGDVGGMLGGSVGANLLGFTGGCIPDNGKGVLGVGYGGSLHLWLRKDDEQWFPQPYVTGHFGHVNDIAWSSTGSYLISVSSDQTCRLFAETKGIKNGWKEISRPQIHGYDLNSVVLSLAPSYQIFSGGDEKIIRVFDAPLIVIDGLEKLCNIKPYSESTDSIVERVQRAYIPELGLSNKSADLMSKQEKLEQETRNVTGLDWSQPPLEGQLADHTIWPETKKLFAHNYDIVAMTLSNNGKILASSCKARNSHSAGINTWDTGSMLSIQNLMIHESTVVCLKFSHNDKFLASSGKDRALCIFKLDESTTNMYEVCIALGNAHKRIVWDLCWSGDSSFLITASRDGFCKIWTIGIDQDTKKDTINCISSFSPLDNIAVTAIDILPKQIHDDKWLTVIGSESGEILLYYIGLNNIEYIMKVDNCYSHGSTVKRLRFRPIDDDQNKYWFASCSEDFSVRIFNVSLK